MHKYILVITKKVYFIVLSWPNDNIYCLHYLHKSSLISHTVYDFYTHCKLYMFSNFTLLKEKFYKFPQQRAGYHLVNNIIRYTRLASPEQVLSQLKAIGT
jgi:hypothetical protein